MVVLFVTGVSMLFGLFREVVCAAYLGTTGAMDSFLIAYMPFDLIQPASRDMSAEGIRVTGAWGKPGNTVACCLSESGYLIRFRRFCQLCGRIGLFIAALYLIIFWFGRYRLNVVCADWEWLLIISVIAGSIFLAMLHAGLNTHFVNKGNVLFQVSQNLWINIGIILLLLTGNRYGGTLVMAFGVMLGAGLLVILEYLFLRTDIKGSQRPESKLQLAKLKGVQASACKARSVSFSLQSLPVIFILLQAIGSKGTILVERTLGIGLPQGSIASLNYALRLYAFPFTLLLAPIIFPMVPRLASAYREGDFDRIRLICKQSFFWAAVLVIPSIVLINLLGQPFVALLLQRGLFTAKDTQLVAELLLIYSFGSFGWIILGISVRVLWIMDKSGLTVVITWLGIVQYYLAGYFLVDQFGVKGMAASSAIFLNSVGLALFFAMKHCLRKEIHDRSL